MQVSTYKSDLPVQTNGATPKTLSRELYILLKTLSRIILFSLLVITLFRVGGALPENIYKIINYLQIGLVFSLLLLCYISFNRGDHVKVDLFELIIILSMTIIFTGKFLVYGVAHLKYFITVILYFSVISLSPPKLPVKSIRKSFRYFAYFLTGLLIYWYFYAYNTYYFNPNGVGQLVLTLSVLVHLLLFPSRQRTITLFLLFILILSTNSRAAIISIFVFYVLVFSNNWRWNIKYFLYLLLGFIFLAFIYKYYEYFFASEFRIITRGLEFGEVNSRNEIWETIFYTLNYDVSYLLFGFKDELIFSYGIHSAYIEILYRFGLVGLFLMLVSSLYTFLIRLHSDARKNFITYSLPFFLTGLVESNGLFTLTSHGVFIIIVFWVVHLQYGFKVKSYK